ncbi:MAG: exodeoxyribonuclease VII large subunit [Paludibacteraceae bacterium]
MNSTSLSELTNQIQLVIRQNFTESIWVRAEISELRENGGHCYMEFIEKDSDTDSILAKLRATCWSNVYRMLKPYFESSTGETLGAGLKVLVAVTVEFNGVYGFSLNIRDIDPTFTIGELAARRMQIIRQLEADGIADMNKQLDLPLLPQRLAIISSATAAGYGDFCDQLKNSLSGFAFYPKLFPAIMQGDQAEVSIIKALEEIYNHPGLFDLVVIIRGGGATTDLACFDSYNLALNCAQFPLPIIAGIGHQRDISILDMVAHTSLKTPTAVAEFLIHLLQEAENDLFDLVSGIASVAKNQINNQLQQLDLIKFKIKQASRTGYLKEKHLFESKQYRLVNLFRQRINLENNKLRIFENTLQTRSPKYLLEKGYSITTLNGKRLISKTEIREGDKVRTYLSDGDFESEILAD